MHAQFRSDAGMTEVQGRAKGGVARAKALSKEELSDSARKAAQARWGLPRTAFEGELNLPGVVPLSVANLEDGRRVLTAKAFLEALGRPWKGAYQRTGLPSFLDAKNLQPHITDDVKRHLETVDYISKRGQRVTGYAAELLPQVCRVYLAANEAGAITNKRQIEVAELAKAVYHGLATVGIYQLIDDATGYAKVRARDELQKVLEAYISPTLLPWTERFPQTFYEQLHRVRGWPYRPGNNARNGYIGKLTRALIYDPLPKGVIEKLEEKNPYIPERKGRKHHHHRLLTEDIGEPHLAKQITSVTTLLSVSDDWEQFLKLFARMFPPREGLFSLPAAPDHAGA
jgi:hypothetical protein